MRGPSLPHEINFLSGNSYRELAMADFHHQRFQIGFGIEFEIENI